MRCAKSVGPIFVSVARASLNGVIGLTGCMKRGATLLHHWSG